MSEQYRKAVEQQLLDGVPMRRLCETFDAYQIRAEQTMGDFTKPVLGERERELLYAMGAITGEAGELADAIKKMVFHGAPFDADKLLDEAGDVLYGLTYLASAVSSTLQEMAQRNNAKLAARYPNGFVPGGGVR